jgi:dipeptidyl aminopeptidase/acylaminoacyl peptidase
MDEGDSIMPVAIRRQVTTTIGCALASVWLLAGATRAAPSTIALEAFAQADAISDVAISPDGKYLAVLRTAKDQRLVSVYNLAAPSAPAVAVMGDDGRKSVLSWCTWATDTRLLCDYSVGYEALGRYFVATRLVAVDADGKNHKVLLQAGHVATGPREDNIIDWHPGKPDTVLIAARESLRTDQDWAQEGKRVVRVKRGLERGVVSPAVFELNVATGNLNKIMEPHDPITNMLTDHHGQVRIGYGVEANRVQVHYFTTAASGKHWTELLQFRALDRGSWLLPVAVDSRNGDRVYAFGDSGGLNALWSMDLTGKQDTQRIYGGLHTNVDSAVRLKDGTFLGVSYETDRPHVHYVDTVFDALMTPVDQALPDTFNVLLDAPADRSLLVIRASSDREPGIYYLYNVGTRSLQVIGHVNPALEPTSLAVMQPIHYAASDGTDIPGYITRPVGMEAATNLPLVVLPHDGPLARSSRNYSYLQQFLVSRGYAVLEMNFRGSNGFGTEWRRSAHQDWGGLTYSDIVDGARWAARSGIADPNRIAIVGWGFGGYAALLAATRNDGLFKCAASIAGISDLQLLERESWFTTTSGVVEEQVGSDTEKLKADSPRRHADRVSIPVLLIHGSADAQIGVDNSREMDAALRRAGKKADYLELKDADHQMADTEARTAILQAVEKLLDQYVPARRDAT